MVLVLCVDESMRASRAFSMASRRDSRFARSVACSEEQAADDDEEVAVECEETSKSLSVSSRATTRLSRALWSPVELQKVSQ